VGALALGFAVAGFTDMTLRHAMAAEDGGVLRSESHRILRRLEIMEASPTQASPPESSQVDWWLMAPDGERTLKSAGGVFLRSVPWDKVGEDPVEFKTDRDHLYSANALSSPLGILWVAMDRSPEIQVVEHFRRDLAMLLLVLTVSAAGLGHLIAKRGLRPLRRIRDETALIEAHDLHRRLDASRFPEELTDLVMALNGALARLEIAFTRLEDFSSDLAHELRTPMQNLRAELEGRILRPRPEADLTEFLGSLLEELDRLDRMVEQMLFLARSSVPGAAFDRQPLAAGALLRETAAFFGAAAEEAGVAIKTIAPPELLVHADQRLAHRALQNLLANALRHTPPGGSVTLSAKAVGHGTELAVADTGDGIPAALLSRLGDRFLRAGAEGRNRATGGAGLGLAIVKGIAALHGGAFRVESVPGEGTIVRLRFPEEDRPASGQ
jgi:two-component system heavy metal sensor histidine kinase CusS